MTAQTAQTSAEIARLEEGLRAVGAKVDGLQGFIAKQLEDQSKRLGMMEQDRRLNWGTIVSVFGAGFVVLTALFGLGILPIQVELRYIRGANERMQEWILAGASDDRVRLQDLRDDRIFTSGDSQ